MSCFQENNKNVYEKLNYTTEWAVAYQKKNEITTNNNSNQSLLNWWKTYKIMSVFMYVVLTGFHKCSSLDAVY